MHVPQQEFGIEILVAEFADPAGAPDPQGLDDGAELASGVGEAVRDDTVGVVTVGDSGGSELVQTFGQQCRRHAGEAASKVVEMGTSHDEFTQDQERPALVE